MGPTKYIFGFQLFDKIIFVHLVKKIFKKINLRNVVAINSIQRT
jgi:hypothetical protein